MLLRCCLTPPPPSPPFRLPLGYRDLLNSTATNYIAARTSSVTEEGDWEDTGEVVVEGSDQGEVSDEMAQLLAQIEKLTVCLPGMYPRPALPRLARLECVPAPA